MRGLYLHITIYTRGVTMYVICIILYYTARTQRRWRQTGYIIRDKYNDICLCFNISKSTYAFFQTVFNVIFSLFILGRYIGTVTI